MIKRFAAFASLACVVCCPVIGQEAAVLGGPCLPEVGPETPVYHQRFALIRQFGAAERAGDASKALELARQIVRGWCSNDHWWQKLTDSLARAGKTKEAVTALESLHKRNSNAVSEWLARAEPAQRQLQSSDVFRTSSLGRELAQQRKNLDQRRAKALSQLSSISRPPEAYVATKACPFECCMFGKWNVEQATALYDHPGGTRVIGRLAKGETIDAVTGEVHLRPKPVLVRSNAPPEGLSARPGDIVFLLDHLGEGMGRIWVKGKVETTSVVSVAEHCPTPNAECWGEFLRPEDARPKRDHVWWIQIRMGNGRIGWTQEAEHFSGADKCA